MDSLTNSGPSQALLNATTQMLNNDMARRQGDARFNEGYQKGHNDAIQKVKAEYNQMVEKLAKMEDERDTAQAGLEANIFASREQGLLLIKATSEEEYNKWFQEKLKPQKDKIYQDILISRGYTIKK